MNKIVTVPIAIGMLLGLVLIACNKNAPSDSDQNKIYMDYELFYNQNEGETHAIAQFRNGGASGSLFELKEKSGASVAFNGDLLEYDDDYEGHHAVYEGHISGGTFIYTNTNGVDYTNTVPNGEAIAFPADFNTIAKDMDEDFTWDGTELGVNQRVSLFVGEWGGKADFSEDDLGASKIEMTVSDKSDLPLGSSTVYMDRTTEVDVAEGTLKGGRIRYKYRCTNVEVEIIN